MNFAAFRCLLAGALALALLSGCADFCRDIYNGVRARNEALRHPAGDDRPVMPDYDSYQRERKKLK
ncbi:MAG TPA: hypothetical protein VEP67_10595 [Thiobacillaceae bacterium]|nr:hypothetical protein [Thiobacillaceae bacterium]